MSVRCAEAAEKPTCSSSKKIGTIRQTSGRVAGAEVGIVVQDHVAVVHVVAKHAQRTSDGLAHGCHEERCRVGLGEHVALDVEDARTEVLGLRG